MQRKPLQRAPWVLWVAVAQMQLNYSGVVFVVCIKRGKSKAIYKYRKIAFGRYDVRMPPIRPSFNPFDPFDPFNPSSLYPLIFLAPLAPLAPNS